jgi:hypothetical protein
MRRDDLDHVVSAAIRRGLALTAAAQDAMWGRFLARRAAEVEAWRAFASVMALVTVGVRRATGRRVWMPLLNAIRYGG